MRHVHTVPTSSPALGGSFVVDAGSSLLLALALLLLL
jgi:hypothetical protein